MLLGIAGIDQSWRRQYLCRIDFFDQAFIVFAPLQAEKDRRNSWDQPKTETLAVSQTWNVGLMYSQVVGILKSLIQIRVDTSWCFLVLHHGFVKDIWSTPQTTSLGRENRGEKLRLVILPGFSLLCWASALVTQILFKTMVSWCQLDGCSISTKYYLCTLLYNVEIQQLDSIFEKR